MMRLLTLRRVSLIFEHPAGSFVRFIQEFCKLTSMPHAATYVLDQCQFGTPRRKRTMMVCCGFDLHDLKHLDTM